MGLHRLLAASVAALLGLGAMTGPAAACDDKTRCEVKDGFYLVRPPSGWDGRSPLPTAVFFHGYRGSAGDVMKDEGLGRTLSEMGVMLVAPNGDNTNWSFPGKLQDGRDDFAYVNAVLDDVEKRFPVDRQRLFATGFSVGGSMAWNIACQMGGRFAAYAPIAGAFWDPLPTACPGAPFSLRHVHGLTDATVPMKGRAVGQGRFRQGDVLEGMRRLRQFDGCPEETTTTQVDGDMTCRTWSAKACSSGRELVLCLHPGEHEIDPQWVADGYRWVDSLAKSGAPPASIAKTGASSATAN
ncbi:MAG: alpha/beta hydrolase-fold protein [Alsobacter sp.]